MDPLPGPSTPPPRKPTTLVAELGNFFMGACAASLLFWVLAGDRDTFGWFALAYFAAFLACDFLRRR